MPRTLFSSLLFITIIASLYGFSSAALASLNSDVDASYRVTWLKSQSKLSVNLCYKNQQALQLTNHSTNQAKHLLIISQGDHILKRRGNKVNTQPKQQNNACIHYEINTESGSQWRKTLTQGNAAVLNTQRWFWFSPTFKTAEFAFFDESQKPLKASLPFRKIGNRVQVANTGLKWESRTVIGDLSVERLRLSNTFLNVTLTGKTQQRKQEWLDWIKLTAEAIEAVYGHFPQNHANILIVPIGKQSGPIPWGEVQRGGYPSVHLFIDETRPIQEFIDDWTGSHELSHLFLPKLIPGARWMSEGVASYYQNVARARTGLISNETAWRKMKAGFQRGRRDFNGKALTKANKTMHVYWGGAAYFFLADIRLRKTGQSLDSVLKKLSLCCLPSFERWSPKNVAQKLDALSNTNVFTDLLNNEGAKKQFPISKELESSITLQENTPLEAIFVSPKVSRFSE